MLLFEIMNILMISYMILEVYYEIFQKKNS